MGTEKKQNRLLSLADAQKEAYYGDHKGIFYECPLGTFKLVVKMVDIFGIDTIRIVEVTVGKKK